MGKYNNVLDEELDRQSCISCIYLKCKPFKRRRLFFSFNCKARCSTGAWQRLQDGSYISKFRKDAFQDGLVLYAILANIGRFQEISRICGLWDGENQAIKREEKKNDTKD